MERVLKVLSFFFRWMIQIILILVPRNLRHKKDVSSDTVLITGAGNGLGRLMAERFAQLGSRRLVLWDLNPDGLNETCNIIKSRLRDDQKVFPYVCDVSDKELVRVTAAKVKIEVGPVTILINNCGIAAGKYFLELTEEEIERVFKVNTLSHFWICKAFLPDMISSNHGHLVTIASSAGLFGCEKLVDYSASKHAVVGFEESLRLELRASGCYGIKTTIVCPFFVATGMHHGLGKSKLMPELTPEYVVNEIIDGVLMNEKFLLLPRRLSIAGYFKNIMPVDIFLELRDTLGFAAMMQNCRAARDILTGRDFGK